MSMGEFKRGFTSKRLLAGGDRDWTIMSLQREPGLESFQLK